MHPKIWTPGGDDARSFESSSDQAGMSPLERRLQVQTRYNRHTDILIAKIHLKQVWTELQEWACGMSISTRANFRGVDRLAVLGRYIARSQSKMPWNGTCDALGIKGPPITRAHTLTQIISRSKSSTCISVDISAWINASWQIMWENGPTEWMCTKICMCSNNSMFSIPKPPNHIFPILLYVNIKQIWTCHGKKHVVYQFRVKNEGNP